MQPTRSLDDRISEARSLLRPSESRVIGYLRSHRQEVLLGSAAQIAKAAGTSDATVIRAIRALGYDRLESLRADIARELEEAASPRIRVARTVDEIAAGSLGTLAATLAGHRAAMDELEAAVPPELFERALARIVAAQRVAVFGIGPSSTLADYFTIQLGRFGIDTLALTATGLFLADGLLRLAEGDALVIIAYGRVYPELAALVERATQVGIAPMLITDTLGRRLSGEIDLVLPIPRGRTGQFAMHTVTLAFIEALLVGVAATRPQQTLASLARLSELRARVTGRSLDRSPGN